MGSIRLLILALLAVASGSLTLAQTIAPGAGSGDLSGMWRPLARNEDGSGMDGDYAGLPLNAAGRWRSQSWVPENFEVPELVCRPHAWDFSLEAGASRMRWVPQVFDPTQQVVAYHGRLSMREQETTIWMDGRPHPPDYERHSWSGFTTGVWEGSTLVQTATHLKEAYTRRWGPDAQRPGHGANPLEADRQLPARNRDHVRPGLHGGAVYPDVAVLGA